MYITGRRLQATVATLALLLARKAAAAERLKPDAVLSPGKSRERHCPTLRLIEASASFVLSPRGA